MFYSNQLLSRKGPFGQIWIAATMHGKINRRKAEQIDIAEICEQILNPVVPLALRLSGILMGGVVLIYNRKVKYFSEDVKNLLVQIKLITATTNLDTTSLPKEKTQAKFEAITIEYGLNEEQDEFEKEMLRSSRIYDMETACEELFFYVPETTDPDNTRDSSNKFQAEQEKITIQDQLQPEEVLGIDNEDRLPPPDNTIMDDLCPEFQIQDKSPPEIVIPMDEEGQQSTVQGQKQDQDAAARSSEESPARKRAKTRKRKRRAAILDTELTEIPAEILKIWLREPEDIVKIAKRGIKNTKLIHCSTVERHFQFPSSSLSWNIAAGVVSSLSTQILEVWNANVLSKSSIPFAQAAESPEVQRYTTRRTTELAVRNLKTKTPETDGGSQDALSSAEKQMSQNDDAHQEEMSLHEAAEILQNIQEGGDFPNFADYGSIEKLRSALHTPDESNRDDWLINRLGLTPRLSGQSTKTKENLRMSTPSSGKLSLDRDVEFPKQGSRARRSASIHGDMSPGFELHPDEYLRETIGASLEEVGDKGLLCNSLSQFVLEETWPSQNPIRSTQQPIDKLTSSFLQILRELFDQQPKGSTISSSEFLRRANRSQAAKFFYQVCVMASNRFVSVEQRGSFGEILLRRGPYL